MSRKLQPVRGTHDILPEEYGGEFEKFHAVVTRARELATLYGFKEMATPIFEPTEVFARSLGDTSDIVHKEMFTFQTKGEESVTLRPEFTAGIVRAFLSNGMQQHLPLKLFSTGPVFRYERPQKGRQRQFHQVNYEWLGDGNIGTDIEVITLAGHFLFYLSGQKTCKLLINTLGDKETRAKYREALVEYLTPYGKDLSEDSQRRLISNPLRILDSKDARDQDVIASAPKLEKYLTRIDKERFDTTCSALLQKDAPIFQNVEKSSTLVRGLDYYTGIVFEFVSDSGELGAQNTVLAGGRYDGLIEQMGGKPTPAIGFAAGIERLILLVEDARNQKWRKQPILVTFFIIPEIEDEVSVLYLASLIRVIIKKYLDSLPLQCQATVDIIWKGSLSKKIGKASQRGATHTVILGNEEVTKGVCTIKNMKTGEQQEASTVKFKELENGVRSILKDYIAPHLSLSSSESNP